MTEEAPTGDGECFARRSGYTPGKGNPDGTLTPLDSDELRDEALRFRRGADRALVRGDAETAERLQRAADGLQGRADDLNR
jgi:hypothetical protein